MGDNSNWSVKYGGIFNTLGGIFLVWQPLNFSLFLEWFIEGLYVKIQ